MTSLETTNSPHLPQQTQPLHYRHETPTRMLTDDPETSSFSCAQPVPQIKSYFNPLTNETSYISMEVKVHEIGILFNYEIRHARDVPWEKEQGLSEEISSFFDKAGNYFSGLFQKDDDEEKEENDDASSESEVVQKGGDENLLEVEERMAAEMWKRMLEDEKMTWDWEAGCAGLVIEDDERQLQWPTDGMELEDGRDYDAIDPEGEGNGGADTAIAFVANPEVEGSNATDLEGEGINGTASFGDDEDILDTFDTTFTTFSGTKLLGMTYQPLDYVKHDGCLIPDSTCTAVQGQISVAYSGINEYGVVRTIIEHLQNGMDAGVFIPPGSPALNIEFQSAGGTAPSGGNGQIISLNTDRGTGQPEQQEEEGDLSDYGTLFVCLVGILGAGFLASMYVRYKKRKRRKAAKMSEGVELTQEEYEANLAMQQEVVQEATYKTDGDSSELEYVHNRDFSEPDSHVHRDSSDPYAHVHRDSSETDSHVIQNSAKPDSHTIQVELEVPQVDSNTDSNEVEISLTASKTY